MKIKKFTEYNEGKEVEFEPLSNDIEVVSVEIEDNEDEKFDAKEFEIESIIDIIVPEDKSYGNELEESVTTIVTPGGKVYKRGEIIYISALLRKKGTTSFNSPAVQGVLKLRITDIFYGLQYLNKVIN